MRSFCLVFIFTAWWNFVFIANLCNLDVAKGPLVQYQKLYLIWKIPHSYNDLCFLFRVTLLFKYVLNHTFWEWGIGSSKTQVIANINHTVSCWINSLNCNQNICLSGFWMCLLFLFSTFVFLHVPNLPTYMIVSFLVCGGI